MDKLFTGFTFSERFFLSFTGLLQILDSLREGVKPLSEGSDKGPFV
jgi:hypothetical protein